MLHVHVILQSWSNQVVTLYPAQVQVVLVILYTF